MNHFVCLFNMIACSLFKLPPMSLIVPFDEKSTGQYRLQALFDYNNPTDFNALAISSEQKYPLYFS